jgi:hypothetical protein
MDPPYLGLLKGNYGISGMSWFKDYQKAFINTSRFRPIQHVMGFVLILGYCLEYPHLKRAHEHRATAPFPPAPPQRPRAHRAHARASSHFPGPLVSPISILTLCFPISVLLLSSQTSSTHGRRRRRSRATTTEQARRAWRGEDGPAWTHASQRGSLFLLESRGRPLKRPDAM